MDLARLKSTTRMNGAAWVALLVAVTTLLSARSAAATGSVPALKPGDTGGEVAIWQGTANWALRLLAPRRRFTRLAADGVFGPLTEEATRRVQRSLQVRVTGVVSPSTWKALVGVTVTSGCGWGWEHLREGIAGGCVGWWQIAMDRWLGRDRRTQTLLIPDGVFGPLTEAVTLAFQRSQGLAADGIAGPLTWRAAGRLNLTHLP